jgi:hypothetical protein
LALVAVRAPARATPWALLVACSTLAAVLPDRAFAAEERIDIDYSAPSGCPSADDFIAQVLERTDSAELASEDELVRTFVVEIVRVGTEVSGSLVIREPDGSSSQSRSLRGAHCSEVAMALALATALAIDPNASFAPRRDEPPEDAPAEPSPAPLVAPASSYDIVDPPDPWEPPGGDAAMDVMVGPAVHLGLGPEPALGGVLLLEGRSTTSILGSGGVELMFATIPMVRVSGAAASFDIMLARPHLCLFPVPARGRLRLLSCVGAEVGAVRARGSDLPRTADETRLWAAGSLGPRLLWDLGRPWSMDLHAIAAVPFKRYAFGFDNPNTDFHEAGPVVLAAALRFGAHF